MPTTTIETPLADTAFERRVAKQLSFWWRRHGADINHVITRFVPLAGERVYSGPFPMAGHPGVPDRPFAMVRCEVSHERDASFKAAYAETIRSLLAPEIPAERVFVAIQPTDPANHFTPRTDPVDTSHLLETR